MGLRKRYGQNSAAYWRQPRWWLGVGADGIAGSIFTFTTPLLPVEFLLPIVAASQMAAGYLLGVCCFRERGSVGGCIGLLLLIIGVVLLTREGDLEPGNVTAEEFWGRWLFGPFLLVVSFWTLILVITFARITRAAAFVLLSAFCDGVQFLGTRTMAATLEKRGFLLDPADFAVLLLKAICVILVLHFQQLALGAELSRIGAALPVLQNIMSGTLGATFFGDALVLSPSFVTAGALTVAGLVLLGWGADTKAEEQCQGLGGTSQQTKSAEGTIMCEVFTDSARQPVIDVEQPL